jgi:hypothetical protein
MSDLIDRKKAIDATKIFTKDCTPEHFVGHPNFIEYMDSVGIMSFGNWQYANGFNMGLTAAEVAIKELPSAESEIVRCKECKWKDVQKQSTIDAVEVVRCKDCVYFSEPNSFSGKCTLRGDYIFTNDFCSYAVERRTDA